MAWVAAHNVVVSCCGASGWCEYEQASDIVYPFMLWFEIYDIKNSDQNKVKRIKAKLV